MKRRKRLRKKLTKQQRIKILNEHIRFQQELIDKAKADIVYRKKAIANFKKLIDEAKEDRAR